MPIRPRRFHLYRGSCPQGDTNLSPAPTCGVIGGRSERSGGSSKPAGGAAASPSKHHDDLGSKAAAIGSVEDRALSPSLALVGLRQLSSDRQAQPGAAAGARSRPVPAIEAIENVRRVIGGNPAAGVGNGDGRCVSLSRPDTPAYSHHDPTEFGRGAQGVVRPTGGQCRARVAYTAQRDAGQPGSDAGRHKPTDIK